MRKNTNPKLRELENHPLKYLGILILSGLIGIIYNFVIIELFYGGLYIKDIFGNIVGYIDWSLVLAQGFVITAVFIGLPLCYIKLKTFLNKGVKNEI